MPRLIRFRKSPDHHRSRSTDGWHTTLTHDLAEDTQPETGIFSRSDATFVPQVHWNACALGSGLVNYFHQSSTASSGNTLGLSLSLSLSFIQSGARQRSLTHCVGATARELE